MFENDKAADHIDQPLMSTGTTEAGFKQNRKKPKSDVKPKIGATIVGDK